MAQYRAMNFLPTIKCSQCSIDIEISKMGEHICGGNEESTPPPEPYENFKISTYNISPLSAEVGNLKPLRAMPPRVDTSAANRPFLGADSLTPVSLSPSQSNSPATPSDYTRSSYGRPNIMRSATTPIPPSPDVFSSNLDNIYSPYSPAPRPVTPVTTKPRTDDAYGGFKMNKSTFAPPSPRLAPESRRPFDMNRSMSNDKNAPKTHLRQKSLKDATMSTRIGDVGGVRPNTASGHSRTSTASSSGGSRSGFGVGMGMPRRPKKDGYEGFGPPPPLKDERRELLKPEDRSQSFPRPSFAQNEPSRSPSAPDTMMRKPFEEPARRRPSGSEQRRRPSMGPDLSRPPPPRGVSLLGPRSDARMGDAPPVPSNVNLAVEFGSLNPYHTPSTSQSSDASGYSEVSKVSSRSSPPKSVAGSRRKSSDVNLDVLMSEVQASMNDLQPRQLFSASPPPMEREQFARGLAPIQGLSPSFLSPESPMDPAIQDGRLSPLPSRNPARSLLPQTPVSPPKPTQERPPIQERRPSRPTTSKGNCKGCRVPIKGKSISSADGRLSGRYHKDCFVCTTCSEPFQTSTFYVIDDAPYCERHYHKLNGSTCRSCDRGIEGQYLESERREKFHPGCLTCADCRRVLKHDYFEMNGLVYCEKDAWRRNQQQQQQQQRGMGNGRFLGPPGVTNRMERRTTRLMMM